MAMSGPGGPEPDALLDLVGDVGDHLDRAPQVVAAALLADHALVDLAGGEVVVAPHAGAQEALVVAQVQVGLGPVVGDVDLAVLERAHGARIHVDVGVELDHGDLEPARLQQGPREADAMPLPSDDTTPPVMKMNLVISGGDALGMRVTGLDGCTNYQNSGLRPLNEPRARYPGAPGAPGERRNRTLHKVWRLRL
jgi:hypothetical protein